MRRTRRILFAVNPIEHSQIAADNVSHPTDLGQSEFVLVNTFMNALNRNSFHLLLKQFVKTVILWSFAAKHTVIYSEKTSCSPVSKLLVAKELTGVYYIIYYHKIAYYFLNNKKRSVGMIFFL